MWIEKRQWVTKSESLVNLLFVVLIWGWVYLKRPAFSDRIPNKKKEGDVKSWLKVGVFCG